MSFASPKCKAYSNIASLVGLCLMICGLIAFIAFSVCQAVNA
jgi:preprotein translocase subunit Sss1